MRVMALLTIAGMTLVAAPVAAQPPRPPRPPVPPALQEPPTPPAPPAPEHVRRAGLLGEVERALRLRERLELSEEQVARLEALRQDEVERRLAVDRETADVLSRARAGYEAAELRERLEELREAERRTVEERRSRLESILTESQRQELRQRVRAPRRDVPRASMAPRAAPPPRAAPAPRQRLEGRARVAPRIRPSRVPPVPRARVLPRSRFERIRPDGALLRERASLLRERAMLLRRPDVIRERRQGRL